MPSQSQTQSTTTKPKLRDSCLACSSSKIRCPREKPACSRCVRRKVNCEYLTSRRAGRKHDVFDSHSSRNNATLNKAVIASASPGAMAMLQSIPNSTFGVNTTTTTTTTAATATATSPITTVTDPIFLLTPQSFGSEAPSEAALVKDASQTYPSLLVADGFDFDALLAPLASFPIPDEFDTDLLLSSSLDLTNSHDSNSSLDGMSGSVAFSPDMPTGGHDHVSQTTFCGHTSDEPIGRICNVESSCGIIGTCCSCLIQIIELMKQLFPRPSPVSTPSTMGSGVCAQALPSASTIIERNRSSIDTVSEVLACPCSDDAHILAITAQVVSKVLQWYAIAARTTPVTSEAPPRSSLSREGSRRVDGSADNPWRAAAPPPRPGHEQGFWGAKREDDNSHRMAAQLVLGELHHIQRLMAALVAKLNSQRTAPDGTGVSSSHAPEPPLPLPPSAAVLDLLGADLKERLRALSLEIVKNLRNN
ncbi:hypothetical protein F4802DRAFT_323545 [Xylaria palmicola]|nr:hypothetical protein F4802DRAFT_323545 [Xylaria palmicola]